MDKVAFIIGETFIYWNSIILTLAVAGGICLFVAFYVGKSGNGLAAGLTVPLSIVLSTVCARFVHWYCRTDSYASFHSAMTDYTSGGYALLGVFAGCFLAALLLRLLWISRDLPQMLDSMCLAGCAAIGVGRLASFFSASDRGQIVEKMTELPWVYPVTNAVSGVTEYRLATFVIQAMVAGVIFLVLTLFYGIRHKKIKSGDITLLFLLLYGASQVVLDSTRYDSLFFRSNGFVSVVQVFSALGLGLAIVVFSVRMVKTRGVKAWYLALWLPIAACIGGAGYMEYHVQRHGDQAVFAYTVMSACLAGVILLTLIIRLLAATGERKKQWIL